MFQEPTAVQLYLPLPFYSPASHREGKACGCRVKNRGTKQNRVKINNIEMEKEELYGVSFVLPYSSLY